MTTAEQRFDRLDSRSGPSVSRKLGDDTYAGARYRLLLVLAGLVALVGWGLISELGDARTGAESTQAPAVVDGGQQYDGRGKWGGYMPEWRSRSQILQDAGTITDR